VPYGKAVLHAEEMAHQQAGTLAQAIASQGGPRGLEGKQIVALVAYLQRLGTDIKKPPPSKEWQPTRDLREGLSGLEASPGSPIKVTTHGAM
jgi:cytochrome c oxidase cbb3-type subunit I/II